MIEDRDCQISPNSWYYDEFFDFDKMGPAELRNLIFGVDPGGDADYRHPTSIGSSIAVDICPFSYIWWGEDPTYYLFDFLSYLMKGGNIDEQDKIHLEAIRKATRRQLYKKLDEDLQLKMEIDFSDERDFASLLARLGDDSRKTFFFGQEEASFAISPSLFAKERFADDGAAGILYDSESIFELYGEGGYSKSMLSDYRSQIGRAVKQAKSMDYEFLSWMQCHKQFSPLIQFTSRYEEALRNALMIRNPNSFMYKDSAIYLLTVPADFVTDDKNKADNDIRNMEFIASLKEKIVPGSKVKVVGLSRNEKELDFTSYEKMLEKLVPKVAVFDNIPSTGVMESKYTKYVLFHGYAAVKGKMFAAFKEGVTLSRHVIKYKEKAALKDWLYDNEIRRHWL